MKRKVIGLVLGTLLIGGSIGFSASTSLIGAKVTGTFTLEQDGKKLADAVIINGSAYVPVRIMSKATNTDLIVEGKKITIEKQIVIQELTQETITRLRERLVSLDDRLKVLNQAIVQAESDILLLPTTDAQESRRKYIADLSTRITATETEIAEIQTQLSE